MRRAAFPAPLSAVGAASALAGLLLAVAPARAAEDAGALLSRVEKTYRGSPSYSMTFVQSYAPAGFPDAAPETGELTLQAPASLRFKYDGPEGKVYTFDGQTARQYVAADKQLIVKRLTSSERARLPLLFLQSPAEILARHTATVAEGPNGLTELTLVPKDGGEPKSVTATVAATGEVKRLVVLDGEGNRTTFTFTALKPGKRRPASDFVLVPPAGTRTVSPEE